MATVKQMLFASGGSFEFAEKMVMEGIRTGRPDLWLDISLLHAARGKIDGVRHAQEMYAKFFPNCPRLKFNQSWMKLYDGDLRGGLEHCDVGRIIKALGKHDFSEFACPIWNGEDSLDGKTVALYGEGGFGDQIMCVRSAWWLRGLGAKVVIGCSHELTKLFDAQGEFAVVDADHLSAVRADYVIPMLSSFRLCRCSWDTLWTGPYIKAPRSDIWERIVPRDGAPNIGLRWSGHPKFEEEQLRLFPAQLMFKSILGVPAQFWSLQKGDVQAGMPTCVQDLEPLLGDWVQTACAIAQMDLVISSCTSVAHLAAAMGKPTWVVVPVAPYYPWVRPGRTSHWYPTVSLFRQKMYGQWQEPFDELGDWLKRRMWKQVT